jgi:hypothetical protein
MDTPAQHRRNQAKFQKKPSEVKKRETRNAARRKMEKRGLVHKGDGKDVDHKHGVGRGNSKGNLRVLTKHDNRSYPRTSSGKQIRRPK